MTDSSGTSKNVNIPRRFVPVRNGTAFSGMKQLGDASTWDDELEPYVRWSDYERLTAALAACQTYDYRTLADEVERLEKALALQVEQEAANWRRGEDERNRLRAALVNAEAVMAIVEPRSDKAEYLACLAQIRRQCLGFETILKP